MSDEPNNQTSCDDLVEEREDRQQLEEHCERERESDTESECESGSAEQPNNDNNDNCDNSDNSASVADESLSERSDHSKHRKFDNECERIEELNESICSTTNDCDAVSSASAPDEQPIDYSSDERAHNYKIIAATFAAHENISALNTDEHDLVEEELDNWRSLEKWGESVNVFDNRGFNRRLVSLSELKNYFTLRLTSVQNELDSVVCALVNSRYPRFYSSTVDYYQRWRMRYNLFVDAFTTGITRDESAVVHIGEIHLYFDIVPKYNKPFYVNSSFYPNKGDISGVCIGETLMNQIVKTVNSLRYSKEIFELQFPISGKQFRNCNFVFDKFMERQTEFVEESQIIHRKAEQKKKRYDYWNQKRSQHSYSDRTGGDSHDRDVIFEDSSGDRNANNEFTVQPRFQRNNTKMRSFGRQFSKRFEDRRDTYSEHSRPEFAQQNGFRPNVNRSDYQFNTNNRRRNGRPFRRNNFEPHVSNMRKNSESYMKDDNENLVSVNNNPNNYRRQQFTRPGYQFDITTN